MKPAIQRAAFRIDIPLQGHDNDVFRLRCGLRTPGLETENAPVAQWIERLPPEQEVEGSNPFGRIFLQRNFPGIATEQMFITKAEFGGHLT